MEKYTEKLTLHIPHYMWHEKLVSIDFAHFREYVIQLLSGINIDSFYIMPVTGYYKGRNYDEELLTIFCGVEKADEVVMIFEKAYSDYNDMMHQEEFAYERNDKLYIVTCH